MAVFVATVETGSMAAAARALELQPAMIGQQIQCLEEQLGTPLFEHQGLWQRLTAAGAAYHQQCRSILEMVRGAEAGLQASAQQASGLLRVHAPVCFGTRDLAPVLAEFLRAYPEVQVSLVLDDRPAHPMDDGYDLVFHRGEAWGDPQIDCLPLDEHPLSMVASPLYLERQGCPQRAQDLVRHACLGFMTPDRADDPGQAWDEAPGSEAFDGLDEGNIGLAGEAGFEDGSCARPDGGREGHDVDHGVKPEAALAPRVTVQANSALALHALVLQGAGIAVLPQPLVADDLAAGRLVALLPDLSLGVEPLGLLLRNDQAESPALAALVDWALGRFGPQASSDGSAAPDVAEAPEQGLPEEAAAGLSRCVSDKPAAEPLCHCQSVEALA